MSSGLTLNINRAVNPGNPCLPKLPCLLFAEAKLLNIAHQYQQVTDWHTRAPAGI